MDSERVALSGPPEVSRKMMSKLLKPQMNISVVTTRLTCLSPGSVMYQNAWEPEAPSIWADS